MDARQRLLARIGQVNDFTRPRPLVTLEEFFEGNDDPGSIGYNLPDPPAPRDFYAFLRQIRGRAEVRDVRVEIQDLEDPDGWPSATTVWIVTTASAASVRSWFPDRLAPDDIVEGFGAAAVPVEAYDLPAGFRAVGAWYD